MIPPIPIGSILPQSVIKITLKPPLMAVPESAKDGTHWLGLKRPRTSRGLYRAEFFAIVVSNSKETKTIQVRVPDFRTLNLPDQACLFFFMLDLNYSNVLKAQYFQPPKSMPPETLINDINRFNQIGNAAKFKDTIFVNSVPVLIT